MFNNLIILLLSIQFIYTQKTVEGSPYSLLFGLESNIHTEVMPQVDEEQLFYEDGHRAPGTPFRYGYIHELNYSMENSGIWEKTENGGNLWRVSIQSFSAKAIGIEYDNFYLPPGSELFVYSPGYEMILGAYTNTNNPEGGRFATPLLMGDHVIIEYYAPAEVSVTPSLTIIEVIHDYRDIMNYSTDSREWECGVNVICETDEIYQGPIDAVAFLDMGGFICSGAMVNNVRQDLTPYFLTAWHCVDGDNPSTFRFYFNKEASACENSWSSLGPYAFSSDLVADSDGMDSDYALLLITDDIEESWEVYYAGWDATGEYPIISCGIHHPGGSGKKINYDGDQAWGSNWNNGPPSTHWKVTWDEGGTEGGSSGSPVYDENFRIVGQLSGGPEGECGTSYALYGKFSKGWNWDLEPNRRFIDWLDPDYTGTLILDGTYVENSYTLGDVNYDGAINILDVIATVNFILGEEPTQEEFLAADVTQDGDINILDVIAIVNIIIAI